jgi:hypothetical protein
VGDDQSLFENIGTVQDGISTLTRPRAVVDAPGATTLAVPRGEVRFEHVTLQLRQRQAGDRRPVPDRAPRRKDRPDRPLGRGQVHAGEPAAALS